MKSIPISTRILIGFTVVALIAVGLGLTAFSQLQQVEEHSNAITSDNLPGMYLAGQIESQAHQIDTLALKFLLTRNEEIKATLEGRIQAGLAQLQTLATAYQPLVGTEGERKLFADFEQCRATYAGDLKKIVTLSHEGKNQEAMEFKVSHLEPDTEKFLGQIGQVVNYNKEDGDRAAREIREQVEDSKHNLRLGLIGVVVVSIIVALLILRTLRNMNRVLAQVAAAVKSHADEISSASLQVSSTSQSLADGSSRQAASLEETSASLEEMSSMTKRNASSAQQAKELSNQTRTSADTGANHMTEMRRAMDEIKASSSDIAKIIKTIDEIAFQTNILALNAAIEAARAGEAGAGFAVVAEEVRGLAARSAQSAKETAEKIDQAIQKSEHGGQITGKVAESLAEILDKARKVDALVAEIAQASVEQSEGIGQVNLAVGQMDKITQSNASSAEEAAASGEELNRQSELLKDAVTQLQTLIGSSNAQPAPAGVREPAPLPASTFSSPEKKRSLPRPEAAVPVA